MREKFIFMFIGAFLVAIALYSAVGAGAFPFLKFSPFSSSPPNEISSDSAKVVAAAASCAAEPEPGVTLSLPSPFNLETKMAEYQSFVNGSRSIAKTGLDNSLLNQKKIYFRIKKAIVIPNNKVDGPAAAVGKSKDFVIIGDVNNGQSILWTGQNHKNLPIWMVDFVRTGGTPYSSKNFEEGGGKGYSTYDVYILKEFVDRNGGALPTFMTDPDFIECRGGGGNSAAAKGTGSIVEENCGVSTGSTQAGLSTALRFTDPNFTKATGFAGIASKLGTEYVRVGPDELPDDGEILIGSYRMTTGTGNQIYDVYYHRGSLFLKNRVGNEVLIYDEAFDATTGQPLTGSGSATGGFFLCTIKFAATGFVWSWFTPVCKPAIYLYPPKETEVNVRVEPQGEFTYTDPVYPEGGWTAWASPNGDLTYQGKNYDYLYYEAKIKSELITRPTQGWVVSYSDLPQFYDQVLLKLGFNDKEKSQFKDYWEKFLPEKDKYFVGLVDPAVIDQVEPMTISPTPDNVNRVRFYFSPAKAGELPTAPTVSAPSRDGFDVMDWGGVVEGVEGFSCVQ